MSDVKSDAVELTIAELKSFFNSGAFREGLKEKTPYKFDNKYLDLVIRFSKKDIHNMNAVVGYEFDTYYNRNNIINLFKIGNFMSFFKNLYSLSVNLYLNVARFIIDIMYLFKTKNSHIQLKYNNKIIFQNSIGLYGFKKKQKTTKYAKRILSKRFIEFFSHIIFEHGDRINIILKGFRKQYKMNIRYLISNLKFRLSNRHKKYNDYYKLLLKKRTLARAKGFGGRSFLVSNGQRITEREVLYDQINSKLYSFLYIRCFYVGSFQHGGIRIRAKNKLPNKFY